MPAPLRSRFASVLLLAFAFAASPAGARDMATDRPDATESPIPVERGRWQLELDAVSLTMGSDGARSFQAAVLNLKRGISERADLQLLVTPLTIARAPDGAGGGSEAEPATVGVRLKHNLAGADGGFAIAVLPFVTAQAGGEGAADAWVAALAIPVAADLGGGFGGGGMLQWADVHDGAGRASLWTATATVGRSLSGALAAYAEGIVSSPGRDPGLVSTTASFGFTYRPSDDLQFDAGARLGLVRDDADVVFAGLSVRR